MYDTAECLGRAFMWLVEMAESWDMTIQPGLEDCTIVARSRRDGSTFTYTGNFYRAANAAYGGAPAGRY